MGQHSVYYVPKDQARWSGRAEVLAASLWTHGVFLSTPHITKRLRALRHNPDALPTCPLDIDHKFGFMGVCDEAQAHQVPNIPQDIACPVCGHDLTHVAIDVWEDEDDWEAPEDRIVDCPQCHSAQPSCALQHRSPLTFARFYVYVADCDPQDWDAGFRGLLEGILGPCEEFWEWAT